MNQPVTKKTFVGLDTLRTLLALSVALGHYFYWNGVTTPYPWSFFLAVDFFFVLSGFVLTQSIFTDSNTHTEKFLVEFVIRRLFRLYPLYLFLFILFTVTIIIRHGLHSDPFYYYFYATLLLQSLGFDAGATHIFSDTTIRIAWSISVELWVGLLYFPVVYRLRNTPAILVLFSAFCAIFCLLLLVNKSPNTMNVNFQRVADIITFGSVRGLLGFALGTLCFLIFRIYDVTKKPKSIMTMAEIVIVGLIGLLFIRNNYTHQNEFVAPFLFLALIFLIAINQGLLAQVLSASLWSPIRTLSYAIYLIHPFYIALWRKFGIPFNHELSLSYIIFIIPTAYVLHQFIEKPYITKGKQLISNLRKRGSL